MAAKQITLYTHVYSPNCRRVQLALDEVKADHTVYSINVMDKPEWFAAQVNPTGKIPAITYGGPQVDADKPSPESLKLNESLVILQFLADLYPDSGLLPADSVLRAKARLFINHFETKVFEGFKGYFFMKAPAGGLLESLDELQKLLPTETGFAVGEKWTIADMAVAPFLVLIEMLLKNDLGLFPAGDGKKTLEALKDKRYARYSCYVEELKNQPAFKANWDEDVQVAIWGSNPVFKRA